jgi:hypothetical protein
MQDRLLRRGSRVFQQEMGMPRGDKSKYTDKQERMAEHIEEGYERRGVGHDEAERRAWATVNKQTGGGNKPGGSGHGKRDTSAGSMTHEERSRAAKKGWATRRRHGRG